MPTKQPTDLDVSRFPQAGALTISASVAAVQIIRALAVVILHPLPGFQPLTLFPPILGYCARRRRRDLCFLPDWTVRSRPDQHVPQGGCRSSLALVRSRRRARHAAPARRGLARSFRANVNAHRCLGDLPDNVAWTGCREGRLIPLNRSSTGVLPGGAFHRRLGAAGCQF